MRPALTTESLQAEIDRRFATAQRELEQAKAFLRVLIDERTDRTCATIAAADRLELERIGAVRHELEQAMKAAKEAVQKAEAATEKRFANVNEWREQSADRERSQQEDRARLESQFLRREVAEAQLTEMRKQVAANTDRLNDSAGEKRGAADFRTSLIGVLVLIAGLGAVISPHIH